MLRIPTIDLKNPDKLETTRAVCEAARDLGFFQIVGHDLDTVPGLTAAKEFFGLPEEEKLKHPLIPGWNGELMRGYASLGAESADVANNSLTGKQAIVDLMESFQVADPKFEEGDQFPTEAMKATLPTLFSAMEDITRDVLDFLDAGLPEAGAGEFSEQHKGRSRTIVRVTKYAKLKDSSVQKLVGSGEEGGKVSRISAHRDLGTLTLLKQDMQGGLEVQDPHDESVWHPVPPVEGALVVNIGNLMQRWTAGYYRSSIHRVQATRGTKHEGEDRWSVIMFGNADDDFDLEPLACCAGQGEWEVQEGVNVGRYMNCKMKQLFDPNAREDKGKCKYDN
jgi:isopenicillin N synthase-like dioxygenase